MIFKNIRAYLTKLTESKQLQFGYVESDDRLVFLAWSGDSYKIVKETTLKDKTVDDLQTIVDQL